MNDNLPEPVSADDRSSSRFTPNSEEYFYAVVDNPNFFQQDAQLIYKALRDQFRLISFGDYLRRYIFRKADFAQPFNSVPISEYQAIITASFTERGVPASFSSSSSRIKISAKNWLTRQSVSREAVLLLGFGLHMTLQDVEDLLIKGLQETRLSRIDPREVLCGYCYAHGLGYHKYADLERLCRERVQQANSCQISFSHQTDSSPNSDSETESLTSSDADCLHNKSIALSPDSTVPPVHPISPDRFESEDELLVYVAQLISFQEYLHPNREINRQFLRLYSQAQQVTAAALSAGNTKNPEEITPTDIEQVMQAAIPRDHHGNLLPMKKSALNRQLNNKRLTRQRLDDLLSGDTAVSRYDLIMLKFYVYVHSKSDSVPRLQFYRRFVDQTNQMLEQCAMGPLYVANPFECFLLMCLLSDDPMGTYADVMELSYSEAED